MTLSADERAAIEARDAATELMGDPIAPPEGVVWSDSCVMRAYDRRVLLAALVASEAGRERSLKESTYYLTRAVDAEARAKALAEALERIHGQAPGHGDCAPCFVLDALAAYREATP